jgi:hypothetical protein
MGFVQPQWKFVPYDWEEALRLPGAWDVGLARWLWERYGLWDVRPAQELLVRADDEVRVAASEAAIAVYLPHAYDVTLNVDLTGYRCELWDLENRRPIIPEIETGNPSIVRASVHNGDALLLAVK